jgi:hypothetical protein
MVDTKFFQNSIKSGHFATSGPSSEVLLVSHLANNSASALFDLQDGGLLVLVWRQYPVEPRERKPLHRTKDGNLDHLDIKRLVPLSKRSEVGGHHLFN